MFITHSEEVNMDFDGLIPLPYRVNCCILLGSWLWLLTIRILNHVELDFTAVLKIDSHNYYLSHERTTVNMTIVSIATFLTHLMFRDNTAEELSLFDFIPLFTILINLYLLLKPNNMGSKRLLSTFRRIIVGNIDQQLRTNDILLSDTLTSYSKVLIDFSIYLCHLINFQSCLPNYKQSNNVNRHCGDSVLLDFVIGAIPTLIRLKQCFYEYKVSNFRNKTHLFNFIKYSTNLPNLVLGIILKLDPAKKQTSLYQLSLLALIVNSTYSFYWDINNDWNLDLFRNFNSNFNILRSNLFYKNFKKFYYLAIISDCCFRYIWLLKLYPMTSDLFNSEFGIFLFQIFELIRRWIWVFIKIEVDYINIMVNERKDTVTLNNL